MKHRIGIITFHASHNYGSMLQAYALQEMLILLGYKAEIINFRSEKQRNLYVCPFDLSRRTWSNLCNDITHRPFALCTQYVKWAKFERFLNDKLLLTKEYNSLKELTEASFSYDLLIVGSDQIWNTDCIDFDIAYFGNFVSSHIPKIAYAPSMGTKPEKDVDKNLVKQLFKGFYSVSVRDDGTLKILREIGFSNKIEKVVDPTLLFDSSKYKSLFSRKPIVKGKYIYFYEPFMRSEYLHIADKIGEFYHLPVICDRYYYPFMKEGLRNTKFYHSAGPLDFLNLIDNAQLVCGHSYHSIIFSILFKKNFLALDGDEDNRMFDLLSQLGLEDRAINKNNPVIRTSFSIKNYHKVDMVLDKMRMHSISYLRKTLEQVFS